MAKDPGSADPWSLVTYAIGDDSKEHVGVLRADDTVCAVPELAEYDGVMPALQHWDDVSATLRSFDPGAQDPIPDARVLAPLRYPRKILCAGANYWSHIAEMLGEAERDPVDPYFFIVPATTVIGPGDPIEIPVEEAAKIDWEGELAVVIGRRARNVSAESAPQYVAGYTVCNDITARGLHQRSSSLAPPFEWDWLGSKGRDAFLPLGPGVTPSWLVSDPHDLHLRLWVNDVLKQDASTSDLITDVWHLVAAASAMVTLEPGDVIPTGTPAGVGAPRSEFLRPGDVVTVEIEGLGRLSNPVRGESPAQAGLESVSASDS